MLSLHISTQLQDLNFCASYMLHYINHFYYIVLFYTQILMALMGSPVYQSALIHWVLHNRHVYVHEIGRAHV